MREVKFYGGPEHGRTIRLDSPFSPLRFPIVEARAASHDLWGEGSMSSRPAINSVLYNIRTSIGRRIGTIGQVLRVAICEGHELLPEEEAQIRHDTWKTPWQILREASMIDEPQEYWAQMVLRYCHHLTDYRGVTMPGRVEVAI